MNKIGKFFKELDILVTFGGAFAFVAFGGVLSPLLFDVQFSDLSLWIQFAIGFSGMVTGYYVSKRKPRSRK